VLFYITLIQINEKQNLSEVLYSKAEQNCEAKAYLAYVEQAILVTTQLDSAYGKFQFPRT